MASPQLCIAILVVNKTSSSVPVLPTRQGPYSDRARPGPTPETISKPSWLWSTGTSEKYVETSEGGPWQALAAVNELDCGADKNSCIPAFPVGVRNRPTKAGRANPVLLSRIASQTAETPHRANCSLSTGVGRSLGDHPPGDQGPTLGPEGWLRPNVFCQCSKGDVSSGGSA